jgi:alkylation response protein AidB-like acyl-CoA dehydrogenase
MDLTPDPADDAFRAEVREFLRTHWSGTVAASHMQPRGRDAFTLAAKILGLKKWLAPAWPSEWGGANLPPIRRYILEQELATVRFPPRDRMALDLAGPVIHTFGSAEQKGRYLPRILDGSEIWCQGFSEAEAGSDVNAIRTSATWNGTHYVVEGRKLWTTNAHFADMMFALVRVRADTGLQPGLTIMLINMDDKRISVRPIRTIDGRHHINEVTIDKVLVSPSNMVGERGRGWSNARVLLSNERVLLAQVPQTRQMIERVKKRTGASAELPAAMRCDAGFLTRLALAEIELKALEFAALRALHAVERGPMTEGLISALKLRGADLKQRVGELEIESLGDRGLVLGPIPGASRWPVEGDRSVDDMEELVIRDYLFDLTATIAGGTSEIQRNVIAGIALSM